MASVILALRQYPQGGGTNMYNVNRHSKHPHRHCGLDPQSRGVRPAPSFPRRRESTGWCAWCRHTGFKAVSTGWSVEVYENQDCDDAGASFSPSPLIPLPSRERGCMVGVVLSSASARHPCGLRIKSAMTVLFSPSAPVSSTGTGFGPLPSRERG